MCAISVSVSASCCGQNRNGKTNTTDPILRAVPCPCVTWHRHGWTMAKARKGSWVESLFGPRLSAPSMTNPEGRRRGLGEEVLRHVSRIKCAIEFDDTYIRTHTLTHFFYMSSVCWVLSMTFFMRFFFCVYCVRLCCCNVCLRRLIPH